MRSEQDDPESPQGESTASAPERPERRADVRQVTVCLVVKMRTANREELGLVRNISAGGLTAHLYSAVSVGAAATFEFASGCIVTGSVLWQRDSLVGIQFDERVDVRSILARGGDAAAREARAPRVELDIKARARLGAIYIGVSLINISQGGAKLRVADTVPEGQKLVLLVDGLPPLAGRVRWTRESDVGVAFYEAVPFDVLAQWIPMVQQQIMP
jgi:hypothetical protein